MVSVNIHVGCMFTYNNTENLYAGKKYEYRPPNRFCSEYPIPYHRVGGMGGGRGLVAT